MTDSALSPRIYAVLGENTLPFGELLNAAITYFDITQGTLGSAVGHDAQYISRIIRAKRVVTPTEADEIIRAFATLAPPQKNAVNFNEFCKLSSACHAILEDRATRFGDAQYAMRQLPYVKAGKNKNLAIGQKHLANGAGIPALAVFKFETDEQMPTTAYAHAIIDYLEQATENPIPAPTAGDYPPGAARERAFYALSESIYADYAQLIEQPQKAKYTKENIEFGKLLRAVREELDTSENRTDNPGTQLSFSLAAGYSSTTGNPMHIIETGKTSLPEARAQQLYAHLGVEGKEALMALGRDALAVQQYRQSHFGLAIGRFAREKGDGNPSKFAVERGLPHEYTHESFYQNGRQRSPSVTRRIVAALAKDGICSEADLYQATHMKDIPWAAIERVEAFVSGFHEQHKTADVPRMPPVPKAETSFRLLVPAFDGGRRPAPTKRAGNYSKDGPGSRTEHQGAPENPSGRGRY